MTRNCLKSFALLLLILFVNQTAVHGQSKEPPGGVRAVSLRGLEHRVKAARVRNNRNADADSIGLSEILGYRWDAATGDMFVLGLPDTPSTAIRIGQLVESFRHAAQLSIGMSLVPQDVGRPNSLHAVRAFPPEIRDTWTLEVMTLADYEIKKWAKDALAAHYRNAMKECTDSATSEGQVSTARVFFVPTLPRLERQMGDAGFTVWFRQVEVVLRPEQDLGVFDVAALPEDDPLVLFASDVTARFAEIKEVHPVFRRLHAVYQLFLLAKRLRSETVSWDSNFWLSEHQATPHPTPTVLPGYSPSKVARSCWGGKYEYSGRRVERHVWGGVLISYGQGSSALAEEPSALSSEFAASIGRSSTAGSPSGWSGGQVASITDSVATSQLVASSAAVIRAGTPDAKSSYPSDLLLAPSMSAVRALLPPPVSTGVGVSFGTRVPIPYSGSVMQGAFSTASAAVPAPWLQTIMGPGSLSIRMLTQFYWHNTISPRILTDPFRTGLSSNFPRSSSIPQLPSRQPCRVFAGQVVC
jgi:hypothetical protein